MSGKIVIIGATGYTGSALAKFFAKDNIDCHLIARNEDELNKLSEETGQKYSICSDVTNSQSSNGSIVLFSTVAVDRGFNMHSVISTAKGAIQGLTTSLAAEFAPKIRVNCIAPSITQSKMAKPILDNARIAEQIPLKHAMKRVGKPEDLAETAKFLLSSNSSWITGQTIHVDGGKINLET
ncbi:MAG: SDR family oxidoreductase [Proteobacteria bacterium]|nr:SDR family oxidoreductase [Pseudomonadota bacterium]